MLKSTQQICAVKSLQQIGSLAKAGPTKAGPVLNHNPDPNATLLDA